METKEKVLQVMKEAGEPLNAGKIAELSGIDRKEVDKAMKTLKEEGAIVSPVRCKWAPAESQTRIIIPAKEQLFQVKYYKEFFLYKRNSFHFRATTPRQDLYSL